MPGLFCEALTGRQVIDAERRRTITDTVLFRALAKSVRTLHLDADLARCTAFGRKPVRSIFTPSPSRPVLHAQSFTPSLMMGS